MDQTQGGTNEGNNSGKRVKAGYVNQQQAPKQRLRRWTPPRRMPVKPGRGQWPQGYYR